MIFRCSRNAREKTEEFAIQNGDYTWEREFWHIEDGADHLPGTIHAAKKGYSSVGDDQRHAINVTQEIV